MRRYSAVIFFIILALAAVYLKADSIFSVQEANKEQINLVQDYFKIKAIEKKENHINIFSQNIVINYWNYDDSADFEAGDIIYIEGSLSSVKNLEIGYGNYLRSRGYFYTIKPGKIIYEKSSRGPYYIIAKSKEKLSAFIDDLYRSDAPFVKALLYGDKNEIDKNTMDILSACGVIHLIAISGFHIGLLALFATSILKKIPSKPRYIVVIFIVIAYVLFTGARPSSVRAAVFYSFYILSIYLCEPYDIMSSGFLLAALFISLNPYILFDAGFTLSFMAVFSIGMFYNPVHTYLARLKVNSYISKVISATISSCILTTPLTYYYFGRISFVSIPANLISVPIVSILYPFMFLSILMEALFKAGRIFSYPVIHLLHIFKSFNTYLTGFNFSFMDFINPDFYKVISVYAVLLIIFIFFYNHKLKENSNDIQGFNKQY